MKWTKLLLLLLLPLFFQRQPLAVSVSAPGELLPEGSLFGLEIRMQEHVAAPVTPRVTIGETSGLEMTETFPTSTPLGVDQVAVAWVYFHVVTTERRVIPVTITVDDTLGNVVTVVVPVEVNGTPPPPYLYRSALPLVWR